MNKSWHLFLAQISQASRSRVACAAVLLVLTVVACLAADIGNDLLLLDFKMRGVKENGEPHWQLVGTRALVKGVIAELEGVTLVFNLQSGDKLKISSSECFFNRATKMGQSQKELRAESSTMRLDGEGYEISAEQQKLVVHSKVRMLIKKRIRKKETEEGS